MSPTTGADMMLLGKMVAGDAPGVSRFPTFTSNCGRQIGGGDQMTRGFWIWLAIAAVAVLSAWHRGKLGIGAFLLCAFVGLIVFIVRENGNTENELKARLSPQEYQQLTACRSDWRNCKDNAQFMNESSERSWVSTACKMETENRVRYGTPVWPWLFQFTHFRSGTDYLITGKVQAREPEVQLQNRNGAMEHVDVECFYDLNCTAELKTQCVTDLQVFVNGSPATGFLRVSNK
jgi:hypothetical protein